MRKELVVAFFFVSLLVVSLLVLSACVAKSGSGGKKEGQIDIVKELEEIEKQLGQNEKEAGEIGEAAEDVEDALEEDEEVDEFDTSQLQRIEVSETELVNLTVDVEDLDKDKVSYTFSAPLDEKGIWKTNYGDAGEYVVTVTATDGENTVEQQVLLVVKKKNVPPVIAGLESRIEINEGEIVALAPEVSDPNKDEVTITYSEPFDEEGSWATDHTSAGEYDVIVTASDGEAETEVKVVVVVNNVNVPPELSGLEEEMTVKEGEVVTIEPQVDDLDGDKVEVSISEPVGDDGVWETSYTDNGEYDVTVTASDGKDTVSRKIKLTVEDVNVPPRIVAIKQG